MAPAMSESSCAAPFRQRGRWSVVVSISAAMVSPVDGPQSQSVEGLPPCSRPGRGSYGCSSGLDAESLKSKFWGLFSSPVSHLSAASKHTFHLHGKAGGVEKVSMEDPITYGEPSRPPYADPTLVPHLQRRFHVEAPPEDRMVHQWRWWCSLSQIR